MRPNTHTGKPCSAQEARLYLRKGEQAIVILEKLGYTYQVVPGQQPKWLEPINSAADSDLVEKIRQLVMPKDSGDLAGSDARVVGFQPRQLRFKIVARRLPLGHFHSVPSQVRFNLLSVSHVRTFIGLSADDPACVVFNFEGKQYWVPASAVAWEGVPPNDNFRH